MKKIILALLAVCLLCASALADEAPKQNTAKYWIKVNKSHLRLYLYLGDDIVKSYPVSIGRGEGTVKKSREDLITPSGTFTIYRVVEDASKLVYDPAWFNEPGEPSDGVYGTKLISFYNKWQIAIHGTNNPRSVGRRATHGCIRLRNRDINELVKYVSKGMKLVIVERDNIPFAQDEI